jgi:hypothetical protein
MDFKKTARQSEAVRLITQSKAKNIMLYGASRSGKTALAVYILIVRACKEKCNQIIVRNTFNSVKNSIWMETLPKMLRIAFPDLNVTWDRTNYIVIFPNGSTIRCAGLDDGQKIERLLGLEMSAILAEECNQIPYVAIERLKTRLAEKNGLRKIILYTQNPTKTSSPYYQAFEEGVDPVDGEAFSEERLKDYLSIKMNVEENLENIDPDYIKMLESLPEKERKRFLLGEYDDSNSGAAVYSFDRDQHVSLDAVKLPGTNWVGSDFNIDYNSDVLASQHANGLYVYDESQIAGDTFMKADALKRKGATGASIVADSTGKNRRTSGKSDYVILKEAGFNVVQTLNPAVTDKIANLNRCFTLGLIKIHPNCKKLIRDLIQLKWDKHGQLDQKTDPSLSHLVDCLAYLCWKLYPLINTKSDNATISGYM